MEEQEIDLADYLSVMIKRKRLILSGTVLCVVLAVSYGALVDKPPPEFEARASLLVIPPPVKSDLHQSPFSISVYRELAQAQDLQQAIVDSLDLRDRSGKRFKLSVLSSSLEAKLRENGSSPSLELVVTSTDTAVLPPVRIANVWAALFVQENNGLNNREAIGSYETIMRQYEIARENLSRAEDELYSFDGRHEIVMLKTELEARQSKLTEYQKIFIDNSLELKKQSQELNDLESQIQIMEDDAGRWIGSLDGTMESGMDGALTNDQKGVLQTIIQTREDLREVSEWMLKFETENGLDFTKRKLDAKRSLLVGHLKQLSRTRINAGVTKQTLKEVGGAKVANDRSSLSSDAVTDEILREVLSLKIDYNLFSPRVRLIEEEFSLLKDEVDRLELDYVRKKGERDRQAERLESIRDRHQALRAEYGRLRLAANAHRLSINTLRPAVERRSEIDRLYRETVDLSERLENLELKQARLNRDIELAKSTYTKFAGLLEDARAAKAGQPSDLKVVARAVEFSVVPNEASRNVVALAFGIGLILSIFVAFFMEYFEKAKVRLQGGGSGIG